MLTLDFPSIYGQVLNKHMAKEKNKVSKKLEKIIDQVSDLSVLELSELVKALEDKFGVSASAQVVAAPGAVAGEGQAEEKAEKSEYNIELTSAGDSKIQIIKIVKEITGKGLKEAKDIVDKAPTAIKESVKKEEAEELKKKLEEAGASVELK